jgi:hypothetical protein
MNPIKEHVSEIWYVMGMNEPICSATIKKPLMINYLEEV